MATKVLWTLEQFRQMPDDEGRYELVEGELVPMTFPRPRHNRIAGNLYFLLRLYLDQHKLGEVLPSDTGYVLGHDPDTMRAPDVSFLRQERSETLDLDQDIEGAPDLAIEVVSPNDTAEELMRKVKQYLAAGGRTVWVIYPKQQQVQIFDATGHSRVLGAADTLEAPEVLPGFAMQVSQLFR